MMFLHSPVGGRFRAWLGAVALLVGCGGAGAAEWRLMVPRPHALLESMAVAPSGALVATGGSEGRVHVWDVSTRRQWRSLAGHGATVKALAFDPAGGHLLSADHQGEVRVWRLGDGAVACRWPRADALLSDGALTAVGWRGAGALWSVSDRGVQRAFRLDGCMQEAPRTLHDGAVRDARLVGGQWWLLLPGELRVAEQDGKLARQVKLPAESVRFLDAPQGRPPSVLLDDGSSLQFDAQARAGAVVRHADVGSSNLDVALTPEGWAAVDGSLVLALGRGAAPVQARPDDKTSMHRIALAGEQLVAAAPDGLLLLDRRSGALNQSILVPGATRSDTSLATSPDGRWLAQAGSNLLLLWDLKSGRPAAQMRLGSFEQIRALAFLPGGRQVLLAVELTYPAPQQSLVSYDLQTGSKVAVTALDFPVADIAIDARAGLAFVGAGHQVSAHALDGLVQRATLPALGQVRKLSLSADGARLMVQSTNHVEVHRIGQQPSRIWSLAAADLSRLIAAAEFSTDGTEVWIAAQNELAAYPVGAERTPRWRLPVAAGHFPSVLRRSPDGQRLGFFTASGAAWVDTRSGKATPVAVTSSSRALAWVDAANLMALADDGSIQLFRDGQGEALLELVQVGAGDRCMRVEGRCDQPAAALVRTFDGRFDTDDLAELSNLDWYNAEQPGKPVPFGWLARAGFEPRLLRRTLATGVVPARRAAAPRKLDPPEVRVVSVTPSATQPSALRVELAVRPRSAGLDGVQLRLDGMEVARFGGKQLQGAPAGKGVTTLVADTVAFAPSSAISPAPLQLEAVAYDLEGVGRAATHQHRPVFVASTYRTGTLFLLSIGVNRHENASFDLAYAANDAKLIQDSFAGLQLPYPIVATMLVADSTVTNATKDTIRTALQILAGTAPPSTDPALVGLRAAAPEDRVIISFAGHGLTDAVGEFFLVPFDTGPGSDRAISPTLLARSIAGRELASWLNGLRAQGVALVIDACHAAAAVNAQDFVPGPMDSPSLAQLAYDRGFAILVATQADDVALESGQLRHGLLSYALVAEGLALGKADMAPRNGFIGLREWLGYAVERVPELSAQIRSGTLALPADTRGARRMQTPGAQRTVAQVPSLFYFPRGRRDEALVKRPEPSTPVQTR